MHQRYGLHGCPLVITTAVFSLTISITTQSLHIRTGTGEEEARVFFQSEKSHLFKYVNR